jgi:dTDP-4-dehydrorhamnose reductase
MLGDALYEHFSEDHVVLATDLIESEPWLEQLDVRDYHRMHYVASEFRPNVIMNLAAMTDLEKCESSVQEAVDTNTGGSCNCALLASKLGATYVYISTAGIFDGAKEYYDDFDDPNPTSVYGKTKYWGELAASTVPNHVVLRCGWQMGSGNKDKKFIGKIMKQLKGGASDLNVVKDKQGTPTYVRDFTRQIDKMLEQCAYGVWNAVGQGEASRYDVAVELVRLLNLNINVNVVPSSFWAKEYSAPRPPSEKLITTKLNAAGLNVMRPWRESLSEYVAEYEEFFKL